MSTTQNSFLSWGTSHKSNTRVMCASGGKTSGHARIHTIRSSFSWDSAFHPVLKRGRLLLHSTLELFSSLCTFRLEIYSVCIFTHNARRHGSAKQAAWRNNRDGVTMCHDMQGERQVKLSDGKMSNWKPAKWKQRTDFYSSTMGGCGSRRYSALYTNLWVCGSIPSSSCPHVEVVRPAPCMAAPLAFCVLCERPKRFVR